MPDTPQPTTKHGRYVLTVARSHNFPAFDVTDILQIEDEARAAHLDALTAAVEALNYSRTEASYRAAVLAILRGEQ